MAVRTLENCSLIKKNALELGKPKQYDDKCEGYAWIKGDEPCDKCINCKLNTCYDA